MTIISIHMIEVIVPALPPPPKSPLNVRKNPFNDADSTASEDEVDTAEKQREAKTSEKLNSSLPEQSKATG